jgi:hypothetical protein
MLQIALSLPSGSDKFGRVSEDEVLERLAIDWDEGSDDMAILGDKGRLTGAGDLVDDLARIPR